MGKKIKSIFSDLPGLDEKSVDFLTKALERSNLPGFDYLEFKQSLEALNELHMDTSTAIKSAFATAATVGLTKDKLLKTAAHYKSVLNTEKQQFDLALENQIQQRIKSKETEVEKLRKQIEEFKTKIQQLQEKIDKSQNTIDHADEDIRAAREKIEKTREGFEFTLQSILNQIDKDIEDINQNL